MEGAREERGTRDWKSSWEGKEMIVEEGCGRNLWSLREGI